MVKRIEVGELVEGGELKFFWLHTLLYNYIFLKEIFARISIDRSENREKGCSLEWILLLG